MTGTETKRGFESVSYSWHICSALQHVHMVLKNKVKLKHTGPYSSKRAFCKMSICKLTSLCKFESTILIKLKNNLKTINTTSI